jgi:hypothetical protein
MKKRRMRTRKGWTKVAVVAALDWRMLEAVVPAWRMLEAVAAVRRKQALGAAVWRTPVLDWRSHRSWRTLAAGWRAQQVWKMVMPTSGRGSEACTGRC